MRNFILGGATLLAFAMLPVFCAVSSPVRRAHVPASFDEAPAAQSRGPRASVEFRSRDEIVDISERIDELVEQQLAEANQRRNRPSGDAVFLRRIYLDVVGRIPTLEETRHFLESNNENKRAELIDQLLDSYGYVSRQFNFWADLLRIRSQVRNISGQPYIDFVKDSLEQNKPYDVFVRELLTSRGPNLQKGNGAVGYYLRDVGMPEDNMSNTIRVFLGTRLECAQCHDHPYDKWTQRDYFEMVAFTGGMQYRIDHPDSKVGRQIRSMVRDRNMDNQLRRAIRRMVEPLTFGVQGSGTALARLPEGFMGEDGYEGEIVTAKTMFGKRSLVEPTVPEQPTTGPAARRIKRNPQLVFGAREIDSRTAYAEWMTSDQNPRFAKTVANRLWKQAMGLGLIEPVDIIEDATVASNPKLMDFLSETMVELEFDMKQFLRAIYNTRTYQSNATGSDIANPQAYCFNGPVVRRMSAEQIWDSLLTMAMGNVDQRYTGSVPTRYFGRSDVYQVYEKVGQMSAREVRELAEQFVSGNNKVRMSMMSDQMVSDRRREANAVKAERDKINAQIRQAKRRNDKAMLKRLINERNEMINKYQQSRRGSNLRRASEIASPAPRGHFLREFGQSDRVQIDNANTDPAVTQVLSLMNGFIEQKIGANPNTELMKNVLLAENEKEKIEAVFLTMLNRPPTKQENDLWLADFENNLREAYTDLIWTLVNSNEFVFVK